MPAYTTGNEYLAPARIHADRARAIVEIEWADGHRSEFGFAVLRWLCPCAYCRGEGGAPGWLDSAPTLTPAQTQLVDLRLVGSYAIAPAWGDGHDSGFFTFELLRANCPCGEHGGARGGGQDSEPGGARGFDHSGGGARP